MKKMYYFILFFGVFLFQSKTVATPLTLRDFLLKVESQSPDIAMEKAKTEEMDARSNTIDLPPPMLGVMTMTDPSGNNRGFEVTQEIPFPSKIYKQKSLFEDEFKTQFELQRYNTQGILENARLAFFDFWKSFEVLKTLTEKKKWMEKHLKLAKAISRYEVSSELHYLEIETLADKIAIETLSANIAFEEKKQMLKVFAPDLSIDDIEPIAPEFNDSMIEAQKSTLESSSLFNIKKSEIQNFQNEVSLTKQSYFPDFTFRYRSYEGNDMTAKNEEVMVGLTLPFLFFWQPHSEASQSQARLKKAEAEFIKFNVENSNTIQINNRKLESLREQIKLYQEKLIPRTERRIRLIENQSTRTLEALDVNRMIHLDYFEAKINSLELRYQYEQTLTDSRKILTPNGIQNTAQEVSK